MLHEIASHKKVECSEITLSGTAAEIDEVRRMLQGMLWLNVHDGQTWTRSRYEDIPPPEEDPMVPVKFTVPKPPPVGSCTLRDMGKVQAALDERPRFRALLGPDVDEQGWRSPSFFMGHIGAGDNSYMRSARILANSGWECLRSRRGVDGRFWERWMLPGAFAARDVLLDALALNTKLPFEQQWKANCETVVDWAIRNVNFGTLDSTLQRACLTFD